jgi:hypothetical protein
LYDYKLTNSENCAVWKGDLTDENKALQLLLIVIYMADWAHDYYREMIKNGLKTFRVDENIDLQHSDSRDTDILSQTYSRDSHEEMSPISEVPRLGISGKKDMSFESIGFQSLSDSLRNVLVLALTGASFLSNAFTQLETVHIPQLQPSQHFSTSPLHQWCLIRGHI